MKAPPGDTGPRLRFTIVRSNGAGSLPDGRGVYKARIRAESGGAKTPIDHDVWVTADKSGVNGHITMEKPADMIPHAGRSGSATRTNTTRVERTGPIRPDELTHFNEGHYTGGNTLEGGGHGHDNTKTLDTRGYEKLTGDQVRALRARQKGYEDARADFRRKEEAHAIWRKTFAEFTNTLGGGKEIGKLNNPTLDPKERTRIEGLKATRDAAIATWKAANPSPSMPPKPKPEAFGLTKAELLSERHYYYQDDLGTTGAKIGGVSSTNAIHEDGHTWFPPGWDGAPIMAVLETSAPGIAVKPIPDKKGGVSANKRTAWIRKNAKGDFDVAPPSMTPAAAKADGYLKSSMIVPTDGAQRTVFPEMNQT
jgi:hypothetical protein